MRERRDKRKKTKKPKVVTLLIRNENEIEKKIG